MKSIQVDWTNKRHLIAVRGARTSAADALPQVSSDMKRPLTEKTSAL